VTYGGDSGNRIFVLYWRCLLIRVSVIRGSTVLGRCLATLSKIMSNLRQDSRYLPENLNRVLPEYKSTATSVWSVRACWLLDDLETYFSRTQSV
jgi:hypothetical protein